MNPVVQYFCPFLVLLGLELIELKGIQSNLLPFILVLSLHFNLISSDFLLLLSIKSLLLFRQIEFCLEKKFELGFLGQNLAGKKGKVCYLVVRAHALLLH